MLQRDTLWLIATPSEWHVSYALQLAGLCRVAIEKPIAANSEQAKLLMALVENDTYPMDHKLFNASALSFVDEC
jgi:predicted dehydrogenase